MDTTTERVIVAGTRDIKGYIALRLVEIAMEESGFKPTEIVSGGARGIDEAGEDWARAHKVPVKRFPADWNRHGKSAGPKRNIQMAEYGTALVAVWDGKSRGTQHMIYTARERGLRVHVHKVL